MVTNDCGSAQLVDDSQGHCFYVASRIKSLLKVLKTKAVTGHRENSSGQSGWVWIFLNLGLYCSRTYDFITFKPFLISFHHNQTTRSWLSRSPRSSTTKLSSARSWTRWPTRWGTRCPSAPSPPPTRTRGSREEMSEKLKSNQSEFRTSMLCPRKRSLWGLSNKDTSLLSRP